MNSNISFRGWWSRRHGPVCVNSDGHRGPRDLVAASAIQVSWR
ncbi:UNVERIFIED_ORG: hypothetical protein MaF1725_ph0008 [Mycobacterium phage ADLER F1725]